MLDTKSVDEVLNSFNTPIDELSNLVRSMNDEKSRRVCNEKIETIMNALIDIEFEMRRAPRLP